MPSAERITTRLAVGAGVCLLLVGALAACNTTQQTAARLKVRSKRLLADRRPIEVTGEAHGVKVLRASLLRGAAGTAVAVDLRNSGPKPINDLPLEVGLERGGRFVPLNHKPSSYFQAHAPALAPGEVGTWVFTTTERVGQGAAVARVGPASKPPTRAAEVPKLEVERVSASPSRRGGSLTAVIHNPTGLPQYEVAVYAWARRGGRYVAAGRASLDEVNVGESARVRMKLIGDPGNSRVHVFAPATIFE